MRDKIFEIISNAINELNEELDYDSLRNINEETPIFGGTEGIDSLSLVLLVTAVESGIYNELDKSITLADEKAMSMHNSPYRSVGALLDFSLQRLENT